MPVFDWDQTKSFIARNWVNLVFLVIIFSVNVVYALEQETIIQPIIQDNYVPILLIFVASIVFKSIVMESINYTRDQKIDRVLESAKRLEDSATDVYIQSVVEARLDQTGLHDIAGDLASRVRNITHAQSYDVNSIYGTYSVIYDLMSQMEPGDQFYGWSTILGEWVQDLEYYHRMTRNKSEDGVTINRYFVIPKNLDKDELSKWIETMTKHAIELRDSNIYFVLERDVEGSAFLKYPARDGAPRSLLQFVEFGLFDFKASTPVLVYRTGTNEWNIHTRVTCDPTTIAERNIFEKLPTRFRHQFVDEDSVIELYYSNGERPTV
ncbi:MAG: hypothetical protein AAF613_09835 [Pseudomonadota bacterium]